MSDTPISDAATRELERKLNIATALLDRADDLLSRANIMLDGWPQALKWHREYERELRKAREQLRPH